MLLFFCFNMHDLICPAICTFIDVGVAMLIGLKISVIIAIHIFDLRLGFGHF